MGLALTKLLMQDNGCLCMSNWWGYMIYSGSVNVGSDGSFTL